MGTQVFNEHCANYLAKVKKTSGDRKGRKGTRDEYKAKIWLSYLVIPIEVNKNIIKNTLKQTFEGVDPEEVETVVSGIMTKFETAVMGDADMEKGSGVEAGSRKYWNNLPQWRKTEIIAGRAAKKTAGNIVVIVGKFDTIKRWKSIGGIDKANMHYIYAVNQGVQKYGTTATRMGELGALGGSGKGGVQLEHGNVEIGGLPTIGVRAAIAEALRRKMDKEGAFGAKTEVGPSGKLRLTKSGKIAAKMIRATRKAERSLGIKLSAHNIVTADGELNPEYIATIEMGAGVDNQEGALSENDVAMAFENDHAEMAELMFSNHTSLANGILDTTLHNLTESMQFLKTHPFTIKGKGTPKKKSDTKAKGKGSGTITEEYETPIINAGTLFGVNKLKSKVKTPRQPRKASQPRASRLPLELIGLINKELPNTVEGNMEPPRLTNRTGRFARSTRVVDINMTPQGFPSFGYTYQRDPYGVHEQDAAFDPRTLIDASIREIAAQHAIGRFYTRRV